MRRVLKIEKLTTGYLAGKKGGLVLQREMTATLETGQLICVLGPNGAGKSTLLRTLAGFQKPLSGAVFYDDKPLTALDLKSLARLVSVVLTDRFSDLYLTAFDVVRMGRFPYLSFFGRMRPEDMQLIHKTMEKLGTGALKQKLFYNLSDGERQKVLIARALVQDTPFLLLDEPVAFIDSPGRIEIMELLIKLAREQKKAILMTTHDMETALHYADQLWLMHRDKPLLTGIPEDMVLQGYVGAYFHRSGLRFDVEKGRFRAESDALQHPEKVFVKNESPEALWLAKALERNGFQPEIAASFSEKGWFAEFAGGKFHLYRNGKKINTFQNIAALLNELSHVI